VQVIDRFNIGLTTPGAQAIAVDRGVKKIQPLHGVEPGAWKAKQVMVLG
jgi:hypothetical protein